MTTNSDYEPNLIFFGNIFIDVDNGDGRFSLSVDYNEWDPLLIIDALNDIIYDLECIRDERSDDLKNQMIKLGAQ
jgi:hypothetical protein